MSSIRIRLVLSKKMLREIAKGTTRPFYFRTDGDTNILISVESEEWAEKYPEDDEHVPVTEPAQATLFCNRCYKPLSPEEYPDDYKLTAYFGPHYCYQCQAEMSQEAGVL